MKQMYTDLSLLKFIKENKLGINTRLLCFKINKEGSPQTTKEIIILDKEFRLWLEKIEIEVILDKNDIVDSFKLKKLNEENKLVGTEYFTYIEKPVDPSIEYYIGRFIGYLFIIVEYTEINEQIIYDFENLKKFIQIDTVSKKINEGILTTEETINALKEQIAKDYNDKAELYKSGYQKARLMDKSVLYILNLIEHEKKKTKVDFKLIESLKIRVDIKPRILHIIINKEESPQTTKEIIILDKEFGLGLEKTEIEVFLNKLESVKGFKVKVKVKEPDEDELVGTEYLKIPDVQQQIEIPSIEYYISEILSHLFGGKKDILNETVVVLSKTKINELVIYTFDEFNTIEIDTMSQKINEGILTTEETINELKEQIAKDYNDNTTMYSFHYVIARMMDKDSAEKLKNEKK